MYIVGHDGTTWVLKIYYRLYSSRPWDIWHEGRVFIMFPLDLSYRFISRDVDIRNKEIIQKSE